MSFADGFTRGFGMIDAAMNRRELMDMRKQQMATEDQRYQENVARDETRYQDNKGRVERMDQRALDWHAEEAKRQAEIDAMNKEKNAADIALRKGTLDVQRANAQTNRAQAQVQIEAARLQQQYAKEQQARQEAALRAQNLFTTDPDSGMTTLNLTPGNELNDLKDIQTAFGVNVMNVARDLPKYQQHISEIKGALVDPSRFQSKKASILEALNDIEGHDINKGLGDYDGSNPELIGGKVVKKEISDIYPSPDGRGFVFNVKTHIKKGGKTYTDEGPMTKYRTSNPADNEIRVIGAEQIIQRLEGYDAMAKTLAANPQFVKAINGLSAKQGKGKKTDYEKASVPIRGDEGIPTGEKKDVLMNKQTGQFIDPEEALKTQKELRDWAATAPAPSRGPSLYDAAPLPAPGAQASPVEDLSQARALVSQPYQRPAPALSVAQRAPHNLEDLRR